MAQSARSPATAAPTQAPASRNRLLAALGQEEYQRLSSHLTRVELKAKFTFWTPNQPVEAVYFPVDLVTSILALTDSGPIEVGTVGNEGVVGLPLFLGSASFAGTALVQIPGGAERMDSQIFRQVTQSGRLRDLMQRYTLAFMTQVSQGTACNRAHSAEQRLARWLLIVNDRVGRDEFPLTQEFMSQMLGVRRATVSETAAGLQRAGLIKYGRGVMRIQNRARLEQAACECYRIVRDEFERLLGVPAG
jgi:CRP-like cAMP-binding protein